MNKRLNIVLLSLVLFGGFVQKLNSQVNNNRYISLNEIKQELTTIAAGSSFYKVSSLAITPGGKEILLFSAVKKTKNPAIFVAANMPGNIPIASSGALYLANYLMSHPSLIENYSWYILPCGNPDAYSNDLTKNSKPYNASAINNDMDEQTDEDPDDDLNGDGMIHQMRKQDPFGEYVLHKSDPRLMVKASDTTRAALRYSIYSEGLDNDADGLYNEDGLGGVNIAHTFPYGFDYLNKTSGNWPGSEKETLALLEFFSAHPEICLSLTLGEADFLRSPFIESKKATSEKSYAPPSRYATYYGLNPKQKYTLNEFVTQINQQHPESNMNEIGVLRMLNTEPLKEPLYQDQVDYETFSNSYKTFIKPQNADVELVKANKPSQGSFELWAYYHLGIPSIAMRLWDVPILKSDSTSQKNTTSRDEAFLCYNDSLLKGIGFAGWKPFSHPSLGMIEIGGANTLYQLNPPEDKIEQTLKVQVPWIEELVNMLPVLEVKEIKKTKLAKNTYKLEVFVYNNGKIAWPLAIGEFNRRPAPVVLIAGNEEVQFLEGQQRTRIGYLAAGKAQKLSYLLQTKENELHFAFDAKNVLTIPQTIKLK